MNTETCDADEICRILRISRQTLYNLRATPGRLPPSIDVPGARRLLWRRTDIDAWIAHHVHAPSDAVRTIAENPASRRGRPRKTIQR